MEKKSTFLSGSSYEGSWEPAKRCMDGFGTYTYPDCSEYRGYFQNGKFHGYGRLRLAAPYKFTVEGSFEYGVLKNIAFMWFYDGLTMTMKFDGNNSVDFSAWKYCTKNDRRYVRELVYGLEPVAPGTLITSDKDERVLEEDTYDTEEGVFKAHTGFITECTPPFRFMRYVNCAAESEWIRENCRRAEVDVGEPIPEDQLKILNKSLDAERELQKRLHNKAIKTDPCRQYFYKLCEKEREENGAECVISDPDIVCPVMSETSPPSSFSASSLKEDNVEMCQELEIRRVLGISEDYNDLILRRPTFEKQRQTVHFKKSQ